MGPKDHYSSSCRRVLPYSWMAGLAQDFVTKSASIESFSHQCRTNIAAVNIGPTYSSSRIVLGRTAQAPHLVSDGLTTCPHVSSCIEAAQLPHNPLSHAA